MASNKNAEKYLSNDIFFKKIQKTRSLKYSYAKKKKKRGVNLQEARQR